MSGTFECVWGALWSPELETLGSAQNMCPAHAAERKRHSALLRQGPPNYPPTNTKVSSKSDHKAQNREVEGARKGLNHEVEFAAQVLRVLDLRQGP